ncbi:gliding motility-associated C-terminal domain-containing protein [Desertivirga xinjiangensis]|uniref:T9SS type B sorting domain-containing protein n=1 Tax=Desertivirga xinjiangensis TaxID=539206 RepID=UPI00210935F3|nr:gliding motility-associated C-terminal domain-containing protein [Pedobacter xinjiangensis]
MKKKLLLIVGAVLLASGLSAQSVVINKLYNNTSTADNGSINGQGDGVELLVLEDFTDLRGAFIKDFYNMGSGSSAFVEGAQYQFSQNALWSNLKAGTTIVLIRPAIDPAPPPALDVDASDFTIQTSLTNEDYLVKITTNNTWNFNLQGTDGVVLKRGDSPNGFDNVIHFFFTGYGSNASLKSTIDEFTFPKMLTNTLLTGTTSYSGFAYANSPTVSPLDYMGIDDTSNDIIGSFVNSSSETRRPAWGLGEPGNNRAFIEKLRAAPRTPEVVVNRVYNSGTALNDVVELLVLRDHMDMRGMYIKDISGGTISGTTYNDTGGKYQFSDSDLWKDIRKGTTIVLRTVAAGVTQAGADLDTAGRKLDLNILNQSSSPYLTYISGSFNLQNYDFVTLKKTGSNGGADGFEGSIHIFAFGVLPGYRNAYDALPEPKIGTSAALSSTQGYQYPVNNSETYLDFIGFGTDYVADQISAAPQWGNGQTGKNAEFIASLRPVPPVVPEDDVKPIVAINRIFNSGLASGEEDVVELLVIKDHTDLRGAFFKDISGGTTTSYSFNDGGGKYKFSEDDLWSDLRTGTTIVLRGVASSVTEPAYDDDPSDFRLDVNLLYKTSSKYLTYLSGEFNLQNRDLVVLKPATSVVDGYSGAIHLFANGISSTDWINAFNALPSPKLASSSILNGNTTSTGYQYALSPTQSVADFNGIGANFVGNSTTTAPVWGNGHPGTNADYITSLRPVIPNQPVIKSGQIFSVPENSVAGTEVGEVLAGMQVAGTFSNWTILYGNTNNMFSIDKSTGVITVSGSALPDFETRPVYYLALEVYNGTIRSNRAQVTVEIENVVEIPVAPVIVGAVAGRLNGFRPEITGRAEFNSRVALYIDDVLVDDNIIPDSLNAAWTYRVLTPMAPGMHTFYFTAVDTLTTNAAVLTSETTSVTMGFQTADIIPHNILTPNGDGKNDKWIVKNLDLYPINEVVIFDKLGKVVYNQKSYQQDWDGTFNGQLLNAGTYYYEINLGPDLKPLKGYLTIIRNN